MLPHLDGWEVSRRIRALMPIPIIMLTARDREDDKIRGLELGADDYVTKPFSPREVVARVRAVSAAIVMKAGIFFSSATSRRLSRAGRATRWRVVSPERPRSGDCWKSWRAIRGRSLRGCS